MIGKRDQIELVLCALLCEGHVLLDDVPGHRQDGARARDRPLDRRCHDRPDPVHPRPAADRRDRAVGLRPARARRSSSSPGLSSRTSCSSTRSTARCRGPRARCSRRWPSGRSRSTASRARCRARSSSWRRRTRSTTRASSRSPRPNSTASSSRRCSATRSRTRSSMIVQAQRHGHPLDRLEPVIGIDDLRSAAARGRGRLHRPVAAAMGDRSRSRHARAAGRAHRIVGSRLAGARARRPRDGPASWSRPRRAGRHRAARRARALAPPAALACVRRSAARHSRAEPARRCLERAPVRAPCACRNVDRVVAGAHQLLRVRRLHDA